MLTSKHTHKYYDTQQRNKFVKMLSPSFMSQKLWPLNKIFMLIRSKKQIERKKNLHNNGIHKEITKKTGTIFSGGRTKFHMFSRGIRTKDSFQKKRLNIFFRSQKIKSQCDVPSKYKVIYFFIIILFVCASVVIRLSVWFPFDGRGCDLANAQFVNVISLCVSVWTVSATMLQKQYLFAFNSLAISNCVTLFQRWAKNFSFCSFFCIHIVFLFVCFIQSFRFGGSNKNSLKNERKRTENRC